MRTAGIIRIIIGLVIALLLTAILIAVLTGNNIFNRFGWDGGWIGRVVDRDTYTSGGYNEDTNQIVVSDKARVDASGIEKIQIDWVAGSITLRVGSEDQIVFSESSYRDLTEKQRMRYSVSDNGTLRIRFSDNLENIFDWFNVDANMPAKDLVVEVPASLIGALSELQIDTVSSGIDLSGVYGEKTSINSVSGGIRCADIESETMNLSSTSGGIVCENCTAESITIGNVSGSIRAEGDYNRVKVDTVSGSVKLSFANVPDRIDVDGVSGAVTVALPENAGFTAKLDSVSGSLSCEFAGTIGKDMVVVGDGEASYRFNSVSGSLHIEKN